MNGTLAVLRVIEAWCELARFDCETALSGAPPLLDRGRLPESTMPVDGVSSATVDALTLAACLYWKPVLCLQRAACLTTMLRRRRVAARLVIGYRPSPFVAHSWVEVDGHVVDGSDGYAQRLTVLHVS